MNNSFIKRIKVGQLEMFFELIQDVIQGLNSDGIDQWDDLYPSETDLAEDIRKQNAYGCFLDDKPVAYMVLNEEVEPGYDEVHWEFNNGKPLIIHRLSVHPGYRGRRIGRALVGFAENEALSRGYGVIRLDAFSLNPAALRLYENAGYRRAGSVSFRKGKFYLYEKNIS